MNCAAAMRWGKIGIVKRVVHLKKDWKRRLRLPRWKSGGLQIRPVQLFVRWTTYQIFSFRKVNNSEIDILSLRVYVGGAR